ncbi:MAG TPA: VWA domain-containing protein [Gemmatimonadales bacterium]|nr:VWA domain-containing protein [Gemmatimonadales bacterium]
MTAAGLRDLAFGAPLWLLALVVVLPIVVWWLARGERRRAAELAAFGDEPVLARSSALPDRARRLGAHLLLACALGVGIFALARPQLGEHPASIVRDGRDVLLLLDLSRSMNVADVAPSRLAAARTAALQVMSASPHDRVGLIVFGGSAFLQLPLTSDHATLKLFLDHASTDDLGDPSTDLASALAAAERTFAHEGERGYQAVLVASDGESGEGDIDTPLAELKRHEIPVFTIGVGTLAGGPVPADSSEAPERFHRDNIGRVVVSHLEEADLRRAAAETGGLYARASDPQELQALATGLSRLAVRALAVTRNRRHTDRYQWPLGVALVGIVLEPFVRRRRKRSRGAALVMPVLAAALCLGAIACDTAARAARRGERLYDAGRWPEAYQAFRRASDAASNPRLESAAAYDAATALYRMRRFPAALKEFHELPGGSPRLKARALYNRGNAAVLASEDADPGDKGELLDQAVTAYEEALRLDPHDRDAKWNLELALRRRGDRPTGSSSGRGRRGDYGRGLQNTPGYEGNPQAATGAMAGGGFGSGEGESAQELSPSEARQLLDAVQRQQFSSHGGRPASRPTHEAKDW